MVAIKNNYHYYGSVRSEILPLLPDHAARVLDVGCGAGNTLLWIKELRTSAWIGGVELDPSAAAQARDKLDAVYGESIEEMSLPVPEGTLDLILCLDVLEQLRDPWRVAQYLNTLLRPGGSLVVSIPNIRNRRVLLPLVMRGHGNMPTRASWTGPICGSLPGKAPSSWLHPPDAWWTGSRSPAASHGGGKANC